MAVVDVVGALIFGRDDLAAGGPSAWLSAATRPGAMALHELACCAGLVGYSRAGRLLSHAPVFVFALIVTTLLGPFGTVAAFGTVLAFALVPASWAVQATGEAEPASEQEALLREATLSPDGMIEPQSLCDVFRVGSLAERRSAVALIGANYRPAFGEALRMALHDEHNAIRVQAGMVMQSLEDEFERKRQAIESRLDTVMVAHGFGAGDVHLELARLYDHQAYSGLLDAARAGEARAKALESYRRHVELHPDDLDSVAALGRLLVRAGRDDDAVELLSRHTGPGHRNVSLWIWLAEALYRARRFDELRVLVAEHGVEMIRALPSDSPLRATLELWRAAAKAPPRRPSAARVLAGARPGAEVPTAAEIRARLREDDVAQA